MTITSSDHDEDVTADGFARGFVVAKLYAERVDGEPVLLAAFPMGLADDESGPDLAAYFENYDEPGGMTLTPEEAANALDTLLAITPAGELLDWLTTEKAKRIERADWTLCAACGFDRPPAHEHDAA